MKYVEIAVTLDKEAASRVVASSGEPVEGDGYFFEPHFYASENGISVAVKVDDFDFSFAIQEAHDHLYTRFEELEIEGRLQREPYKIVVIDTELQWENLLFAEEGYVSANANDDDDDSGVLVSGNV